MFSLHADKKEAICLTENLLHPGVQRVLNKLVSRCGTKGKCQAKNKIIYSRKTVAERCIFKNIQEKKSAKTRNITSFYFKPISD